MNTTDLSGKWRYFLDRKNEGLKDKTKLLPNDGFMLPGSVCDNKIGDPIPEMKELTKENVRCLRERFSYIGVLWLQREIEINENRGSVTLFLERVSLLSEVFIDGIRIGRKTASLSAPHIYDISSQTPGKHILTIKIDNSNLINIDGMASGYSIDTQGIWCGIIGKIEIRYNDIFYISNLQIFPKEVKITVHSDCASPDDRRTITIKLTVSEYEGEKQKTYSHTETLYNSCQILHIPFKVKKPKYWDEFNPVLYTMTTELIYDGYYDKKEEVFGIRDISVKDKEFILNGKAISLRGTLDCAIYPKTGYPPTDLDTWMNVMKTIKEYGLNHIRFHSWCPPENAFKAADICGVYVLAELPLWLNKDVCALETGDDPIHSIYCHNEAQKILQTYGNHPSFIMFSNGNELLGDFEMLENLTLQLKALDNRRLYTLTTNFDRPVTPADDYLSAFEASGNRVRIQVFHDVVSEHTRLSYDKAVHDTPVPIVSFEVGQYCVYPNVDSISDYNGNMAPVNFEVIKNSMIEKGVYGKLNKYIKASGEFAAMFYKEDIEALLRTHKMGGFELLGLSDYTGQCTATVGLLDVFWKSKGIISSNDFRKFCSETVPLFKSERIFYNEDTMKADFDLYDYGQTKIKNVEYFLEMFDGGEKIYELKTKKNKVKIPLGFIKKNSMITVNLSVNEHKNSWNIFVFVKEDTKNDIPFISSYEEIKNVIENGGKAVVTGDNLKSPIQGLFTPVFWSPAYFISQRACGLICEEEHPLFRNFPPKVDFQWKHPIDNSVGTDISDFGTEFKPIIEPVPNFFDNTMRSPLFEANIGKAQILFCGFDFFVKDKSVKTLKNAVYKYISSQEFNPLQTLDEEKFLNLFK